ncbi:permease component II [Pseudomonas syringae pv. actinidiae]|uniref:Permease component II n=1 Tax=Pseudomonas syringae pv. actinidiae TaxID=103796 RepID=A0AAN4TNK2_PSESF|nr:permease component II [Pseudomonas syringae pv. actinidiae]
MIEGLVEGLNANWRGAAAQHTQLFGCFARDIDQTTPCVRATIIDTHDHCFVVVQVGDFDAGAEWQLPVGSGQGVLIERFTAGGAIAMMAGTVVRGGAGLVITVWVDDVIGAASQQGQ